MPLGNSITEGWDSSGLPSRQRIAYRGELFRQLKSAGYSFDFVGHNRGGFPSVRDSDHAGISGITDGGMLRLLRDGYDIMNERATTGGEPYLDVYQPDWILLHIGTNDILRGQGPNADTVSMILDHIDSWERETGNEAVVFLARIINSADPDPEITEYNRNIDTIHARRSDPDLILVDMEEGAGLHYPEDFKDDVHPNASGDAKIGTAWFEAIDSWYID